MSSRNKRKSNSAQKSSQKKPSPTAQILENVELLIALHEEQIESTDSTTSADQSTIAEEIARKLESQIGKRFDAIEEQIATKPDVRDDGSHVEDSSLEKLEERFDTIESKLASIEDQLQNTESQPVSDHDLENRFEAIDTRLEKVAAAIAGQQQLIEERSTGSDSEVAASLQSQFSEMLHQLKSELGSASRDEEADASQDSSGPDWRQQKQAMLSKYGIDPEHRPDMAPPTAPDPVLETTMADDELSAAIELETVDKEISTEPEEIQKIKKELNLKLRDAEVELSIERAKLSQLHAELETKQVELERRNTELTKKFGGRENKSSSDEEQYGLLDRLKRHLTAKDRKNLDRI